MINNEKTVLKKIKKGDQLAFKLLYDGYAEYALRSAYGITSNYNHASDIVQETFLKVYRNIDQYNMRRPFKPWFYKILLNESKRYMKKQNTQGIPIETEQLMDYLNRRQNENENGQDVKAALEELSDQHRTILTLKYISGFKEREISELLELNINTVKSRLYKGRQKLKGIIGGEVHEL